MAEEIGMAELRRLAERARERATSATPTDGSDRREAQREERTVPCPGDCGTEVTYQAIVVDGRDLIPPPHCEECREAQMRERAAQIEAEERQRRKRARQDRRDRIHSLLHDAGVNPWAHGDSTMDSFDAADAGTALRATRAFLDDVRRADAYDPVRGLYLYGPTGTGKTHLAAAVVRELLIDGWAPGDVCMDHAAAVITEIQDCYGSDRSVLATKSARVEARLWILDDLGTERPSDDVVRILTEILNQREGRANLITSNLPPEKLVERHSEMGRIVSRLGPRYYETVEVSGRDRRYDATGTDG